MGRGTASLLQARGGGGLAYLVAPKKVAFGVNQPLHVFYYATIIVRKHCRSFCSEPGLSCCTPGVLDLMVKADAEQKKDPSENLSEIEADGHVDGIDLITQFAL